MNDKRRIAIACQGGGAHTAFTAGVLAELLSNWPSHQHLVGLSGSSGGALCAALAWSACLEGRLELAEARLLDFWEANSAQTVLDIMVNSALVVGASSRGMIPHLEMSPYRLPHLGGGPISSPARDTFSFLEMESAAERGLHLSFYRGGRDSGGEV